MSDVHAARRERLLRLVQMDVADVDTVLVSDPVNVRYLTGFTGSNAVLLLPIGGEPLLGTDGRYVTQCAGQCPDLRLLVDRATLVAVAARAAADGLTRIAVEAEHLTLAGCDDIRAAATPAVDLVPTRGLVERLRVTKDDGEITLLRRACAITDEALADLLPQIGPGMTERQVARRLEWLMYEHGADAIAFDTIVAAGENSAIPHHEPTDRPIERGDLLVIDFGAVAGGYHADETRTFVVGAAPLPWQAELHALVAAAQASGRAALGPGASVRAVDRAARALVEDAGHGDDFGHGLGHGVGLRIHEAPMIGPRATGTIGPGTPVTVEPGVYLSGRGGVRVEDTVLVTADGAEPLTTTPRELLGLG